MASKLPTRIAFLLVIGPKEYYQPGALDRKQKELMAVLWNSGGI